MPEQYRQQIESKVRELLITKLRVSAGALEKFDSTMPMLGSGIGLDSMEAMSLAVEIEEAFGIVILDEDLNARLFSSLDTLTDYIIKHGGKAGPMESNSL